MGTILGNNVSQKSKFSGTFFDKSWFPSQICSINFFLLERFDQSLTHKNASENTNFEIFEEVVHNFGKSDDDMN